MSHTVECVFLGKSAPGLDEIPYPGELGQRVYDNISVEAWQQWLERLVMIVNEYQLNTSDPTSLITIEAHLLGFLFKEGDMGDAPMGFSAA
ncbi:MAG: Fe-S cluster biosynthesis and repair protein YggX [Saprospiraceae bacterium]|jgi:Fe-S cluster biosynthesis and repair protein YggX